MFTKLLLAIFCLILAAPAAIRAQSTPSAACVQDKNQFTCNATAFALALKNAATIAVSSQPSSQAADGLLNGLVRSLGKTSVAGPADLTFLLVKVDEEGINYGPGDRELASLRIYSRGPDGERGPIIWIESFFGQPDTAWQATVQRLIAQFKTRIKKLPR